MKIALGIAPGLDALGYAVLSFNGAARGDLLDSDVLHGGRGIKVQHAFDVAKRVQVHRLILDVVLNRNPPAIIVLGPQANAAEPPEYVALVRLGLMAIAQGLRVPVIDLHEPQSLYAALGVNSSKALAPCLRASVSGPAAVPRDRRLLLATASAVAGAKR